MTHSTPRFPALDECEHRLAFTAFGVTLGVRSNDAELLSRAREALPPGFVPVKHDLRQWFTLQRSLPEEFGAARHRLYNGESLVAEGIRLSPLLESLEDELRLAVASQTATHVFVHAGVVRLPSGLVVMPGRSASGKTTLVRALVDAGGEYWSDEYAVFDEQGKVWPYPRRVSIRQGSNRRHREALTGPAATDAVPMRLLVVTSFEPGARWRPRELSRGDAAMALFNHTLIARIRPAFALKALSVAVSSSQALAGPRGEATTCVSDILRESECRS